MANQILPNQGAPFEATSRTLADGSQVQQVQIDIGTGTAASPVNSANPLPVNLSGSISNYHINDIDDATIPTYFGFEDPNGAWYILRESPANTYRYAAGASNYSTAWTGRAGQTYQLYGDTF